MREERRLRPGPGAWAWAVAALTAGVFSRSLTAGFLDFDDLHFLARNPHLSGASWAGLRWMLGPHWVIWYPVTWLSWLVDTRVWGGGPFGYHLGNVLLHALNAALAFLLFDRLMAVNGAEEPRSRRAAAAFAALVFSLHPLRVESVTWASERGDVLCGTFALGTALAWIDGKPGRALVLHALGLASKGSNIALPVALAGLGALDILGPAAPRGRRAAPWLGAMLVLSAADGLLNLSLQRGAGATLDPRAFGPFERLAIAASGFAHGAAKTLWPSSLQALYPIPPALDPAAPRFLLAALAVAASTAAAWSLRRRAPAAAGAWGTYLVMMAPTAGFFKLGSHLYADRYTYLPALGLAGLAGEGLRRVPTRARRAASAAALAVLAVLAAMTWRRQGDWLDADHFWGAMVATDPKNAPARTYLGLRRLQEGRAGEAEALFREALAIDPGLGAAHNDLGNVLSNTGRPEEAVVHFRAALAARPEHPVTRYNLALALMRTGRRGEAAQALREELALIAARPRDPLRDSFDPPPDEERTRRLLTEIEGRGGVR
jgi:tetratricopeptide (TPR) repeat protein